MAVASIQALSRLALQRHLSVLNSLTAWPLDGGSASKACPDQPSQILSLQPRPCSSAPHASGPHTPSQEALHTPSWLCRAPSLLHTPGHVSPSYPPPLYALRPLKLASLQSHFPFPDLPLQPYLGLRPPSASICVQGHVQRERHPVDHHRPLAGFISSTSLSSNAELLVLCCVPTPISTGT